MTEFMTRYAIIMINLYTIGSIIIMNKTKIYDVANKASYFTKIKINKKSRYLNFTKIKRYFINPTIGHCINLYDDISSYDIIGTAISDNKIYSGHFLKSFSSFKEASTDSILNDLEGDKTMTTNEILNKLKETGKLQAQNALNKYVVPIATSRVKYHFGREYYISSETYLLYDNDIINFFKKYDKKFNDHVVFKDGKMTDVNAYIALIPYDSHTFVYVATKNYVPFFLENKIDNDNPNNNDVYIYVFGKHMNKITSRFQYCIDHVSSSKDKGDSLYVVNSYTNGGNGKRDITYYDISEQHRADNTVFFSN